MVIPGWRPHPGQRAFLESEAPIRVLACGRRWGKTEVVAVEVVRTLLAEVPRQVLVVAPSVEQALIPFERVVEFLRQMGHKPSLRRTPAPTLGVNRSRLWARGIARGGLYLRGRKAHLIVVDEAAYVPEAIVHEVLMPMLADTGGRIALISTPRGRNYFYRLYQQGQSGSGEVWSLRSPSWQNPLLTPSVLRTQASLMTARQYQIEYGAEFIDPEGQVFRTEWVDRAVLKQEPPEQGILCAGVDWARYRDWTAGVVVFGTRQSARVVDLRRWQGLAWAEQVESVANWLNLHGVMRVLCDRTGVGDPLVEALSQKVPGVEGVVFTPTFKQNLVEQLVLMLEQERLALIPNRELLWELYHFEASPTHSGWRLEAGHGTHDDLVMALALAVWALPPAPSGQVRTTGRGRL